VTPQNVTTVQIRGEIRAAKIVQDAWALIKEFPDAERVLAEVFRPVPQFVDRPHLAVPAEPGVGGPVAERSVVYR